MLKILSVISIYKYLLVSVIIFMCLIYLINRESVNINDFIINDSYWEKNYNIIENESINSDLKVDFAIIGGGYTGLSTAYHLADMNPNLKIVLFEAGRIGSGASGKNGGMVLTTLPEDFSDPKEAKLTYDLSVINMKFIDSLCKEYDFNCDLMLNGYCETICDKEDIQSYKEYVKNANKAGIPLEFWDKNKLKSKIGTNIYYGAIFDPNGGSVHAMKLVKLLKIAAEDNGVKIYENSPVISFDEGKIIKLVVKNKVNGKEYKVEAKNIVIATNAYTSKLGFFKNKVVPIHTQVIATEPLNNQQLDAINWNSRLPFYDNNNLLFHIVLTPDNRIIFGGGNVEYFWNNGLKYKGKLNKISEMLYNELIHIYPDLKGIKIQYAWNGIIGVTYDEIPTVGVTGEYENIYYGLGYSGHGVNQSILFGDIIAHLYDDKFHEMEESEFFDYDLTSFPPEPFKYIGTNLLLNYYKWQDKK
jgi:glycine/D-amino acid oxidase-like deaminating enzyme